MFSFFKRFHAYIKPYFGILGLTLCAMLFVDIIAYMIPLAIGHLTDYIFPFMHKQGMIQNLLMICAALILAGFIRGIVSHIMIRSFWHAGEALVHDLRNALYGKLQQLDLAFYDQAQIDSYFLDIIHALPPQASSSHVQEAVSSIVYKASLLLLNPEN